MSTNYSEKIYTAAQNELSLRRRNAEEEQRRREAYVYEKLPEVASMRRAMSRDYCSVIKLIIDHDENAHEKMQKLRERSIRDQQRISVMLDDLTGDPDYLDTPYTCKKCGDTGFCDGIRCECMEALLRRFSIEELNERSTISLRSFDEFDSGCYTDPEVRRKMVSLKEYLQDYCRFFPDGKCSSLLFTGRTGLGKTFMSACIASELAGRGFTVVLGSASDLLEAVENEHFGRAEGDTMQLLLNADLLILDDLGSEFKSQFNEATLYSVLNGRINKRRRTVISTNMKMQEISERYNERITSRIIGGFMPIAFVGTDLRQQRR